MDIQLGYYLHFKGDKYVVLGIGMHSETMETFVVYHRVGHPRDMWCRPVENFLSRTSAGVIRFEYLGPNDIGD